MSNNILFVFEGEKRENTIVASLQSHVFKDKLVITSVFGAEVYQLYTQIKKDPDLDIISLIKKRDKSLADYPKDYFAEVYMFFDYDAHATLGKRNGDNELRDLLNVFDNETEHGKLYISYPMVEALWHIHDYDLFHEVVVKCKGANCSYRTDSFECAECVRNPSYKKIASEKRPLELNKVASYTDNIWRKLAIAHLSKMNYISTGNYELPTVIIKQADLFSSQLKKYINKRCPEVAVLCAFPIFIHDYYGNDRTRKMLNCNSPT